MEVRKKQPSTIRFKDETWEKLEKIREHEQKVVDSSVLHEFRITNSHVIENMIKEKFQDMVFAGDIKE